MAIESRFVLVGNWIHLLMENYLDHPWEEVGGVQEVGFEEKMMVVNVYKLVNRRK